MPTQHLKESLSRMLSKFYPAAGRLRRGKDGKLELVCNNAGVEFVEVTVDGSLSDFEGFKPNKLYTELLDPVPTGFGAAFPDYPITYVQVCLSALFFIKKKNIKFLLPICSLLLGCWTRDSYLPSTRWPANQNRGHSHFPHSFRSLYEYLNSSPNLLICLPL